MNPWDAMTPDALSRPWTPPEPTEDDEAWLQRSLDELDFVSDRDLGDEADG
jgi:hypothetical protein